VAAPTRRFHEGDDVIAYHRGVALCVAALLLLSVTACGGAGTGAAAPEATASQPLTEQFPRGSFDDPTTIDNEWLPLTPGTQWIWEGETVADGEAVPHRVVFAITDLTKEIDGVRTIVGYDQDFSDDELAEAEIVFLAQDNDGNIWHMGQYPEEYEAGEFVAAPAWIAGVWGAKAGIWMKGDPQVGGPSYSQGWGPVVGWTDRARAVEMGPQTCVPHGCFEDVLVIEEWALDEPEAKQLKYYGRGVGNIKVGWSGSEQQEQETLELVEFGELSADELAEVRDAVLALEERAYEIRPEVYEHTSPMEQGS
jgi:hypothetical protein